MTPKNNAMKICTPYFNRMEYVRDELRQRDEKIKPFESVRVSGRLLIAEVLQGFSPRAVLEGLQCGDEPPLNPRAYDIGSLSQESGEHRKFTRDEALAVLKILGGQNDVDLDQFRRGMEVEWEHGKTVGYDLATIGRIVLDHLGEDPEYYTALDNAGLEGRMREWTDVSDFVGLRGHVEGPYSLGAAEEAAWKKAFGDVAPTKVIALFDDGENEVSRLVKRIFNGLDSQGTIKVDGQTRTFGLYQGVKMMLNPDERTASFDVGDRGFVANLSEDMYELTDIGKMEPMDIVTQVLEWAHGDKKKAGYMLDGYITQATTAMKPKFMIAHKLLKTA